MTDSTNTTVSEALQAEMARLLAQKGGCETPMYALLAACDREIVRLRALITGMKRHINDSADEAYDDEAIVCSYMAMGYDQEAT